MFVHFYIYHLLAYLFINLFMYLISSRGLLCYVFIYKQPFMPSDVFEETVLFRYTLQFI